MYSVLEGDLMDRAEYDGIPSGVISEPSGFFSSICERLFDERMDTGFDCLFSQRAVASQRRANVNSVHLADLQEGRRVRRHISLQRVR
jgi:hypothetical protein